MKFTQPNLLPVPWKGGSAYMLAAPWQVEVFGVLFDVPAGIVTDGASVPRSLWTPLGMTPDGLHRAAGLLHDALYRLVGVFCGAIWSRKQCDDAYRELCHMAGAGKGSALTMWMGIRLGGWATWRRYARNPKRKLDYYEVQ